MTKRIKQGPITIEEQEGVVKAYIDTFGLSLAASRREGPDSIVAHEAAIAPSHIETEEQARAYGLEEARRRWPPSEGWSYDIQVVMRTLTFEFGTKA